jgi:acyl-CoA synthetase (AMP-forming)/AMP-acid ligase II
MTGAQRVSFLDRYANIGEVLTALASDSPEREAVGIVRAFGPSLDRDSLSYAELLRESAARARWLRERLDPGSRVLLAHVTSREFVMDFFGCVLAGMVAVPAPVPGSHLSQPQRTAGIVRDSGAALVLTRDSSLRAVRAWARESGFEGLPCAGTLTGAADTAPDAMSDRSTLAYLQYTSGSTGTPKGVMVTHGNLLENIAFIYDRYRVAPGTRFGAWLPMYHDMGLVSMFLAPVLGGGGTLLMQATAFVIRPVNWLRMLSNGGCAFSAAPNFAYDLCVRRVSDEDIAELDLSRWQYAVNGGEPVHAATVAAFTERFAAAGLRPEAMWPSYGSAETTLVAAAKPPGIPPVVGRFYAARADGGRLVPASGRRCRELVSNGRPDRRELRVVDPRTGAERDEGAIGELWLRSASVTQGYWRRPAETAAVFGGVTADGQGGWYRTGDLGAVSGGELYITGRLKEMLIVYGRNLFPQDLESEARLAHPLLDGATGAAFGLACPDERAVLLMEVPSSAPEASLRAATAAVKARLTEVFGASVSISLIKRGGVPRTTSGKIERLTARAQFLEGRLDVLCADLDTAVASTLATEPMAASSAQ